MAAAMDEQLLISPRNHNSLLSGNRNSTEQQQQQRQQQLLSNSEEQSEPSSSAVWRPTQLAFSPYSPQQPQTSHTHTHTLRVVVRRPVSLLFSAYYCSLSSCISPLCEADEFSSSISISFCYLQSYSVRCWCCARSRSRFASLTPFFLSNCAVGGKANQGHHWNIPNLQSAVQLLRRFESQEILNQPVHWSPQRWLW